MNLKTVTLLLLGASLFASCAKKRNKDDIAILGLGKDGESIVRYMPKGKYVKKYTPLLSDISKESTNVLEKHSKRKSWKLKRVSVGMEFVFEAEFFEVWKFEFVPAVELRFQPLPMAKI